MDKVKPFNIELLTISNNEKMLMGEISSLSIFETNTKNFHPDGLFSTEIFGQAGSQERLITSGYMSIPIPIIQPKVFKDLISLKSIYKGILSGKEYGKWDDEIKDFVSSNIDEGETGYSFFLKHIKDLKIRRTDSKERDFKINLIEKEVDGKMFLKDIIVLPSGLREYVVSDDGKQSEDEINKLYRKLLININTLKSIKKDTDNLKVMDSVRYSIQTTLLNIYEYIYNIIEGKNGFAQGSYAKRAIEDGTRNIIVGLPNRMTNLNSENHISFNDTVIGIFQLCMGMKPITIHNLRKKILDRAINIDSNVSRLVDIKSMKTVETELDFKIKNNWTSDESLVDMMMTLLDNHTKDQPVVIGNYYLMCLLDKGKSIELIYDTNLIEEEDKKYLRPMTYGEMLYLSIFDVYKRYPAFLTRYPVAGLGGIYPTKSYLKTTIVGREVTIKIQGKETLVYEYPKEGEEWYNSLTPSPSRIGRLGGD
jgi:hypothetical protein